MTEENPKPSFGSRVQSKVVDQQVVAIDQLEFGGEEGSQAMKKEDGVTAVHVESPTSSIGADQTKTIEIGTDPRKPNKSKPAALKSVRYYVILLALISPFVSTYSSSIISFAIIDMIDPEFVEAVPRAVTSEDTASENRTGAYFELDASCPVSDEVRGRLLDELVKDERRAAETQGEKFQWDTVKQGLLKAAYTFGNSLLKVVGGRLSEIYGAHLTMTLGSLFIGIFCLLAPWMAAADFYLLFLNLFAQGMLGSFLTPALITFFSNWLTPGEKSLAMSLYLVSGRLGYTLSAILCGLMIQAQLSWRYMFYSAGSVAVGFALLFFLFLESRPQDHALVSAAELDYLASKNRLVRENQARAQREAAKRVERHELKSLGEIKRDSRAPRASSQTGAPWLEIMTNKAVWAFVTTRFCVKLACDTVQIELPIYLKRVMHFTAKDNGFLNASNYVIYCVSCIFIAALSNFVNKRRIFANKTTSRKVFQCFASFSVGLVLAGVSFSVCDALTTRLLLLLMFLFMTFTTGGVSQIPLDISERYSGTIHAISSSLGISGAIEPILVGYLTKGHASDRERWAVVWLSAGVVSFSGGLVFLFFGDASIQPFDRIGNGPEYETPANREKSRDSKVTIQPSASARHRPAEHSVKGGSA